MPAMAKRSSSSLNLWNLQRQAQRAIASRDKYQEDKVRLTTSLRDAKRSRDFWKDKFLALQQRIDSQSSSFPPSTQR
jgi:uncharacterized protein YegJ (DUF2314 family)